MDDRISIVIPCKNEEKILIDSLNSIRRRKNYKIIISDSSTDDTKKIIKKFDSKIIIVEGGLPAIARNNGAKNCTSPYILFMDADMDISSIELGVIVDDMQKEGILLGTCRITVDHKIHRIAYWLFSIVQKIISIKTPFAVGGFMIFDTKEFERLGGFDENDVFAEDYHLSMKVHPKKFKIYSNRIKTSNRRLKNKSIFYMARLMIRCWINRKNNDFYKQDYNYWK